MSTDTGGPLTDPTINGHDPLERAAAWGGYQQPQQDGRPWTAPGPPPWAGQVWTEAHPAAKPKTTHAGLKVFVIIASVVLGLCTAMGLIGALAGGSGEPKPGFTTMPAVPQDSVAAPADATTGPQVYKLGKTFRSGDFEYTVHKVKTGLASVGGQYVEQKAQGSFTRLDVSIKNVTKSPRYFDTDLRVKVQDVKGRQFSASTEANLVGNDGQNGLFTEINPGNEIRAFAYFDLPKGAKATKVVVSAGLFSFEADAVVPLS